MSQQQKTEVLNIILRLFKNDGLEELAPEEVKQSEVSTAEPTYKDSLESD